MLKFVGKTGALLLGFAALSACGNLTKIDLNETLSIAMQGTFEAPPAADGNAEPRAVTFEIQGLSLTRADGTVDDLFATETEPKEVRIINRSQIVYEADLHDFVAVDYTKLTLTLAATATAKGKYEAEMPVTLAQPIAEYVDPFTVAKGKAVRLDVSVQWKNTVTRDDAEATEVMTSPTFVLDLASE